ncbi:OsmC family protein [Phycicoccus endophyticus]|uniref:OsmC family protein n=1 Tax=Phycicoccus endophyticus TaxID=1690220 RepID=A0A7G9R4M2_9MICO|nr:OsmC family protein [Phycicoccus endophyticus]NHI18444.1 OsmC family peroxiredoxin [Phycicoccus endophyticus]QNN50547.1 OsmC family protein [Phycicoccus endophyticus]GGL23719.1 osmotically inducible protein C [Phycicoccus endophyticus]
MTQEHTGGTGTGHRSVSMTRLEKGLYEVRNPRGGTIRCGGGGESEDFTPVELLLTAMAACGGSDVDWMTSRLAEPEVFELVAEGEKTKDDAGNHLTDLVVTFRVRFPEGADGDRARERLPSAMARSHDRLCTVTQTITRGTPVEVTLEEV